VGRWEKRLIFCGFQRGKRRLKRNLIGGVLIWLWFYSTYWCPNNIYGFSPNCGETLFVLILIGLLGHIDTREKRGGDLVYDLEQTNGRLFPVSKTRLKGAKEDWN